jgi:hypothetical protein
MLLQSAEIPKDVILPHLRALSPLCHRASRAESQSLYWKQSYHRPGAPGEEEEEPCSRGEQASLLRVKYSSG